MDGHPGEEELPPGDYERREKPPFDTPSITVSQSQEYQGSYNAAESPHDIADILARLSWPRDYSWSGDSLSLMT
jgi:hypothetical protein